MTLHVDDAAEKNLAWIVGGLRSVRLDAGLSQSALSSGLPVREERYPSGRPGSWSRPWTT